ncbi:hypothetical protein DY000_02019771 [Brassica cretica]|uniref:Uncharacterized protein n=1 Tax=Brassica cretica TaxID=69181 RepID=A0ABQ7CTH7_BRACR|nr:hypothetical protein DY000_02019771 [Brassica cretica]
MALSSATLRLASLSFSAKKTNRNPSLSFTITCSSSFDEPPKPSLTSSSTPNRVSSSSALKARFVARQKQSVSVRQLQRPLIEYMSLPASQYSVLDAERIERVDDNTFRCYVYTFKFFNFEVCPVLLVRVEEQPNGCCIKLLSCKLEGSPVVVAQNDKFDASMVNRVSCDGTQEGSSEQQITSDAVIEYSVLDAERIERVDDNTFRCFLYTFKFFDFEVCPVLLASTLEGSSEQQITSDAVIEVPFAFRVFPVGAIEATGTQVLDQILRLMLPRFFCLSSPKTIKHGLPETLQGNLLGLARSDSKSKWTLPGSEKSPIFFKCVLVK